MSTACSGLSCARRSKRRSGTLRAVQLFEVLAKGGSFEETPGYALAEREKRIQLRCTRSEGEIEVACYRRRLRSQCFRRRAAILDDIVVRAVSETLLTAHELESPVAQLLSRLSCHSSHPGAVIVL